MPGLKSALVAALATGAVATINSTVWLLAGSLSWWRLVVATIASIVLVVAWLVIDGELWDRPGLSRRDRRWITLTAVGAAAVREPIQQHVYAALASGDITREEFQEFVLHFAYYAGWPRASALEMAYYRAVARIDS